MQDDSYYCDISLLASSCKALVILVHFIVTYSYLGSIPVQNELHLVGKESKSSLISGGDSSCSWVLVCALGPHVKEGAADCNAGWEVEM